MSMQGISSRNGVPQNVARSEAAAPTSDTAPAPTPDNDQTQTADAPATTPHLSRAGRFLGFLQRLEDKHPEEAKKILGGIADHLRHDADHAGPFSDRLKSLADKFDKAAETGDLSGLVPARPRFGHHAMRAYHDASGAASGDAAAITAATSSAPAASSEPAATTAAPTAPAASSGGASATGNKPDGGASTESATKPTDVTA